MLKAVIAIIDFFMILEALSFSPSYGSLRASLPFGFATAWSVGVWSFMRILATGGSGYDCSAAGRGCGELHGIQPGRFRDQAACQL